MPLYIAPAAAGKTTYVLNRARAHARHWQIARVIVANTRQTVAAHRILAHAHHAPAPDGISQGALGVRILTSFGLAREILDLAGSPLTLVSDPIQIRFLRSLVDKAKLSYYAPLIRKPGFIRALRTLIAELTLARITPAHFGRAVRRMGEPPRLAELARLYAMYQRDLQKQNWVDTANLLIEAQKAIQDDPELIKNWQFVGIDGFTHFTQADLTLLQTITAHVRTTLITLTGDIRQPCADDIAKTHRQTIAQVEKALGVVAQSLPEEASSPLIPGPVAVAHQLFAPPQKKLQPGAGLQFVAAPDETGEVRAALRWLKEKLILDELQPTQVAILARDINPYRDAIRQIAREFHLPVQISGGLPLRQNPAIDALLSLLNLSIPEPTADTPDTRFPFRPILNAWRSPYFDWHWPQHELRIDAQHADQLAQLGRNARVIAGLQQWQEAFQQQRLQDMRAQKPDEAGTTTLAPNTQALADRWQHFCQAIQPPQGKHPLTRFVRWLETLIGQEPEQETTEAFSLNMVARIRQHSPDAALADRDIAALITFKETLRGMVWAAEVLHLPDITFADFFADLTGAIDAARTSPQQRAGSGRILALGITEAAGLRFEAVALLGLAEGSFPAILHEDTFLRGDDRAQMQRMGLPIDPSPRSQEAAHFYQALSRANQQLLLTRPRLAAGGSDWQASPYWQNLLQNAREQPLQLSHENFLQNAHIASHPELMRALAMASSDPTLIQAAGPRLRRWQHGQQLLSARQTQHANRYDGDLSELATTFGRHFGPEHRWSAARLESYRNCPYRFFASSILGLEERPQPVLGLDAQQLGSLYHRALELVFRKGADKGDDADTLIAIWEDLAPDLLAAAPETYGFRPTAWWPQTQEQIKETMRNTLQALAQINRGWRPRAFEAAFGMAGAPPLQLTDADSGETLCLRGIIDRVDTDGQGHLRVIDYKRGSVQTYNERSLQKGKHLQLPFYVQAAAQALGYGQPVDGFYWSITQAKSSPLSLAKADVETATALALAHAYDAVAGARAGNFSPQPPKEGCPDFCPATAFCWHYRTR